MRMPSLKLYFLRADTTQSTLRICVFLITIVVVLNLLVLPILMYLSIKEKSAMAWLPGYVAALGGLSGAGLIGKALQKRFETESYEVTEKGSSTNISGVTDTGSIGNLLK
jgi:hypothetical protein